MNNQAVPSIEPTIQDPSLGDILRRTKGLTSEQVSQALEHQRKTGLRFGEAVVELGLARPEDVVWALSQQFHYPYQPVSEDALSDELVVAHSPFDTNVEAFRDLRTQLIMGVMGPNTDRRALAVLSGEQGEGKSFIAANLAVAFSQLPGRTLLVDANFRTPRLQEIFRIKAHSGLSSILAGRTEPNVIQPIDHLPNLYLLSSGVQPPNPVELLQRASMSLLLRELLAKFDHVLVDTPAAELGPDARIIAHHCGAAMIVGRKGHSRTTEMHTLIKHLTKSQVKLSGILVNEF